MSEITFNDNYTRHVGGEQYSYRVSYTPGETVEWSARVFHDGELKAEPSGSIVDNTLQGDALKQYVIAYLEGIIERGIGIAE